MKAALIIPALNEEHNIRQVLAEIPPGVFDQVLVVDNGSTDQTAPQAAAQGAEVLHEPRRGYGSACLRGIAHLSPATEIVVFLDADGSDAPAEAPRLIEPIEQGQADFVVGSRELGQREAGALTAHQRAGNRLAVWLIRALYGFRYTDLGPFRAIRLSSLQTARDGRPQLRLDDRNADQSLAERLAGHRDTRLHAGAVSGARAKFQGPLPAASPPGSRFSGRSPGWGFGQPDPQPPTICVGYDPDIPNLADDRVRRGQFLGPVRRGHRHDPSACGSPGGYAGRGVLDHHTFARGQAKPLGSQQIRFWVRLSAPDFVRRNQHRGAPAGPFATRRLRRHAPRARRGDGPSPIRKRPQQLRRLPKTRKLRRCRPPPPPPSARVSSSAERCGASSRIVSTRRPAVSGPNDTRRVETVRAWPSASNGARCRRSNRPVHHPDQTESRGK